MSKSLDKLVSDIDYDLWLVSDTKSQIDYDLKKEVYVEKEASYLARIRSMIKSWYSKTAEK